MLRILFCVGDASGDLYASLLVQRLRQLHPQVKLTGVGGPLMQAAGVELMALTTQFSAIGYIQTLRVVANPRVWQLYLQLREILRYEHPDVFIPVDFSAANRRLTRFALAQGVKTVYYVPPGFWTRRIEKVRAFAVANVKFVPKFVAIFPWQRELLEKVGACVFYFGHPLVDVLPFDLTREAARAKLQVRGEPVVALMPGSRTMEVKENFPLMLQAAKLISARVPKVQFLCGVALTVPQRMLEELTASYGSDLPVRFIIGQTHEVLKASDAAIMVTGTVTLEAGCLGVPGAAMFWTGLPNRIQAHFLRLRQWGYIALPNRLLNQLVMPEFILWSCQPERIAKYIVHLLEDERARQQAAQNLQQVRATLGEPGVSEKVARLVVETAGE